MKCLLVIQQNFHSFAVYLEEALKTKGYEVTTANDIYPENIIGTILGKLQVPLVFRTTFRHFIAIHLNKTYDVAIIIRGRGVGKSLIRKMTEMTPCVIGYNWDTFDFNPAPLAWFSSVNKYYTFDYIDAEKYHLPVVELFSALPATQVSKEIKYDISAVGKNHPGRLKYIQRVVAVLKPKRTYIRLHDHNVFYMLFNFIKAPILYIRNRKCITMHPLNNEAYLDAISSAEFTIDYANDEQAGITMRCYEALSLKTKLITNNRYVRHSSYFDEKNTVIFAGDTRAEDLINAYNNCRKATSVSRHRDVNAFVDDLLS